MVFKFDSLLTIFLMQVENAMQRAEDLGLGTYSSISLPPVAVTPSLQGFLSILESPVTLRVINVLLACCVAKPHLCVSPSHYEVHIISPQHVW